MSPRREDDLRWYLTDGDREKELWLMERSGNPTPARMWRCQVCGTQTGKGGPGAYTHVKRWCPKCLQKQPVEEMGGDE